MAGGELNVVTGAFGYTGRYIAEYLLAAGKEVRTLTGHPDRPDPFGGRVSVAPFSFDDPAALAESLRGATTLYNTYWVRFPYRRVSYEQAVSNTLTLLSAAERVGVARIVHIGITNASEDSPFAYFRGKGRIERAIRASQLSYAIVRPTVLFGAEGILINNLAWLLRRCPIFLVPGAGDYRLQPVAVEDVAEIAVSAGARAENLELDAAGPEVYTFEELVRAIARAVQSRARIVHASPGVALLLTALVGRVIGDVLITRDELAGLMANVLLPVGPATGQRRLSGWLSQNADRVGTAYASELARHYR